MNQNATAPLLSLPAGMLPAIHRVLAEDRSPADAALLIRRIGFEAGESFASAFDQWLGGQGHSGGSRTLPADAFWQRLADFFQELGWGKLQHERLHPGVASLTCDDWAEAAESDGSAGGCSLTTGILADLLSRTAGTDLAVMEVECGSRGGDRCRFLFGSEAALEGVYEEMRGGRSPEQALAGIQ
jgi:predicted hydrocarbon binding protein